MESAKEISSGDRNDWFAQHSSNAEGVDGSVVRPVAPRIRRDRSHPRLDWPSRTLWYVRWARKIAKLLLELGRSMRLRGGLLRAPSAGGAPPVGLTKSNLSRARSPQANREVLWLLCKRRLTTRLAGTGIDYQPIPHK
jgi:hypothetical protein